MDIPDLRFPMVGGGGGGTLEEVEGLLLVGF